MNGKRGLSRVMSALLAASSVIGGASAAPKKKVQRPNSAGVVIDGGSSKRGRERLAGRPRAKSAPPFLKNSKTYYLGIPGLVGTAGIGYGLYHLLSKGDKKKEDVCVLGKYSKSNREILSKWGLYEEFSKCLCNYNYCILKKDGFGKLLKARISLSHKEKRLVFEVYVKIDGKKDIIENLCDVYCFLDWLSCSFYVGVFASVTDAFEFMSARCSGDKVDGKFSNIVDGKRLLDSNEYLGYLCDKFGDNEDEKEKIRNIRSHFDTTYEYDPGKFDKLREILKNAGKEIYVNEEDGKLYLRNIEKK